MIYIHSLKDLNPKNADIESVQIIREIKKKKAIPLPESEFKRVFYDYFLSDGDKKIIKNAIGLITSLLNEIEEILKSHNNLYEPIDLERAIHILREIPTPLLNNLRFAEEIADLKDNILGEFALILNKLPLLRKKEEKMEYNQKLSISFEKILRNKELYFNSEGIISEAELEHITSLGSSMVKGFFFHITLEEEIRKEKFSIISKRIPAQELAKVQKITQKILEIEKGVGKAYDNNLRMVNLAVMLYSYIKWAREK